MTANTVSTIEQRAFLKGWQKYELLETGDVEYSFRRFSYAKQYRFPLSSFDKDGVRSCTFSVKWFLAAGFFAIVAVLFLFGSTTQHGENRWALIAPSLVMLCACAGCLYQAMQFYSNIYTFCSRFNGQALITLWFEKPDKATFDAFVAEMRRRIEKATQEPAFAAEGGSFVDEIAKLKTLLDDGALSREEFERAKARLLESPPERRIGFSP